MNLDEFEALHKRRGGVACATCSLPEDVRAVIDSARKKDPPTSYRIVALWLKSEYGVQMGSGALQKHYAHGHGEA